MKSVVHFWVFVSLLLWATGSHADLNSGLVAYFPLQGNTYDMSGNGNDLAVFGATLTSDRFGNPNSAYWFNGISSYLQANQFINQPTGDSAASVNVFFQSANCACPSCDSETIIYWGYDAGVSPSNVGADTSYHVSANGIACGSFYNTCGANRLYLPIDCSWHMLTITVATGSTTEDVYLDGSLVGSISTCAPLNTRPGIIRVGARLDNYGNVQLPFHGAISEIRIYNRVLTASEIQELYGEQIVSQSITSSPITFYASQSTAASTSANGNFMCQGASPVAAMSGDYRTRVDDAVLPCRGLPLQMTRFYNSIEDYDGPFSFGWCFNQTAQLMTTASTNGQTTAIVRWANGVRKNFTLTNGAYQASVHCYDTLSSNAAGFLFQTPKGLQLQFNPGGFLIWQQDRNGNRMTYSFDLQNRISQATSADGRTLTYSYGSDNRVTRIQDWAGRQWNYNYDGADNLAQVQYPDGSASSQAYDTNHFLLASYDRRGNLITSLGYDPSTSQATNYSDGAAISYSLNYNAGSNTTTKTDSLGRNWVFQYNSYGNKQNFVNPAGYEVQLTWTANQEINSVTDARGYPQFYMYDSHGNVLSVSNALGYVTSYTYETNFNQVTSITDALGNVTTNQYDAHGNLIWSRDPNGFVRKYGYDQYGQLTNSIDARGYSTTMTYDGHGDLLSTTDPRGSTVSYTYDNRGNRLSMTDARGNTSQYAYDVMDRLVSVSDPLNNMTTYGYDANGNRISVTDARNNTTAFVYDHYNRLAAVTNALGYVTTYQYDLYGNQVTTTDALGNVVSNAYDVLNRLVSTTDPLGNVTSYTYDQNSNRTAVVDALTNTTGYAFDPLNRTVAMTNALNGVWQYQYDGNNNLLSVTDARNNPNTSAYDARNMVTNSANALGYAYHYQYDGNGNAVQRTDPNGATLLYYYDAGNLLTNVVYPDGSQLSFAYDANRNTTAISNSTETVQYAYDALNRVTNVFVVGLNKNVGYQYDAVGNRSAMIDPNGGVTTYQYDALNRLNALTAPGGNTWTFGYDAINRLASMTMPNGIIASYAYDAASRLTNLVYQTSSNAVLQSFAYTYDAVGNPLRVQREDNTYELYKYDNLYQLTRVDYDASNTVSSTNWTSYAYDPVGNRTNMIQALGTNTISTVYTYDVADRLLTVTSATYAATLRWDKNGNLTNQVVNGTNTWYTWDFENKLVTVTYQNGSNNTFSYYPSSSFRHTKTDSTGTNNYVYDGQNDLQQLNGVGTLVAQYVYSLGIDSLLARGAMGSQQYYLRDMIGSVTAVSDSGQNLLATYRYDVFGAVRRQTGAATNPYFFTARTLDQDSGLYYYRARYLSPALGRFASVDVLHLANPYIYGKNGPLIYNDPSGLLVIQLGVQLAGAIAPIIGLGGSASVGIAIDPGTLLSGNRANAVGFYSAQSAGSSTGLQAGPSVALEFGVNWEAAGINDLNATESYAGLSGSAGVNVSGNVSIDNTSKNLSGFTVDLGAGPKVGLAFNSGEQTTEAVTAGQAASAAMSFIEGMGVVPPLAQGSSTNPKPSDETITPPISITGIEAATMQPQPVMPVLAAPIAVGCQ
jgi:RHS repeat-associated protein